ncbi:unnamed protein product [Urochloa humidicola]
MASTEQAPVEHSSRSPVHGSAAPAATRPEVVRAIGPTSDERAYGSLLVHRSPVARCGRAAMAATPPRPGRAPAITRAGAPSSLSFSLYCFLAPDPTRVEGTLKRSWKSSDYGVTEANEQSQLYAEEKELTFADSGFGAWGTPLVSVERNFRHQ